MKQFNLRTWLMVPAGLVSAVLAVSTLAAHGGSGTKAIEFPISIDEVAEQSAEQRTERFAAADANGDGYLTKEEFVSAEGPEGRLQRGPGSVAIRSSMPKGAFRLIGEDMTPMDHRADMEDEIFSILDADESGELSRAEFTAANQHAARVQVMKGRAFEHLDANDDDVLTPDELPDRTDRLRKADANDDGQITRDEMRHLAQHRRHGA
jgi:Ca2+-binding EF-hand superfamily protein